MDLARVAARNNAAWVDAVARSHGVATRRSAAVWCADGRMPPFYPNLVTLGPDVDAGAALADPPRGAAPDWGLKDSFATLELAPQGFVPVFDALWLAAPDAPWRAAGAVRVTTEAGLAAWVRGWGETPDGAAVFLPGLLDVPGVRLYATADGGAGLAGLVDGEAAGYSNAFGPEEGIAACLAALSAEAGGRPVVGYESGEAAAAMGRLGFRPVGALRVWACRSGCR